MEHSAGAHDLAGVIRDKAASSGIGDGVYDDMLNYTIQLFESQGLGVDYYGYHNIIHELEVTYVALTAMDRHARGTTFSVNDRRHIYTAALFHDFAPQKSVDKPHEEEVIRFIMSDKKVQEYISAAGLDLNIIKALILRTTYPFEGENERRAMADIRACLSESGIDVEQQRRIVWMGHFLSVLDRLAGYSLGPFAKAMDMAKRNAHALSWHPYLIVQRAVGYFERLLNGETGMVKEVLGALPKEMRRSFMDNVLKFLELRRNEIRIQAEYLYENLTLNPYIEKEPRRSDPYLARELRAIYEELPRPLQFMSQDFEDTLVDPDFILNTLRIGGSDGEVIGFAKGGPLERYQLRPEIQDENRGKKNTVFLEPIALKMGYWGLRGGSKMRNMFTMQAHAKQYKYLTSFALRDVVQKRMDNGEGAEFVTRFEPERWDYYRIEI